jgi:translation initiation factor 1 (eIF-1/SUI1)
MENLLLNETDLNISEKEIVITKTNRGRKVNLFISGWQIEIKDMKEHLKNLKRKFGCNGSIKKELIEGIEETVIHLQGDHVNKVQEYIKTIENDYYKITVK